MFTVLSTYNPYIPWDPAYLEKGISMIRFNMGSGINVGLYIFAILGGIFALIAWLSSLSR